MPRTVVAVLRCINSVNDLIARYGDYKLKTVNCTVNPLRSMLTFSQKVIFIRNEKYAISSVFGRYYKRHITGDKARFHVPAPRNSTVTYTAYSLCHMYKICMEKFQKHNGSIKEILTKITYYVS